MMKEMEKEKNIMNIMGKGKKYDKNGQLIYEGEDFKKKRRNEKSKQFFNKDKTTFEGEYLNGEKTGKGKEYMENKLIYEGEYSIGERHGKGKEYYDNGKIKFEGEYKYGLRWNGIINGKIKFEGEYKYGLRWNGIINDYNNEFLFEIKNGIGKGKEYDFFGKLEYEGEYINGERNGKGKEYKNNEIKFEGEFLNGKRWKGIIKQYDYRGKLGYEGEYFIGERNGKGKEYETDFDRLIYEGEYLMGKRHGKGKEYFSSRKIYKNFYDDFKQ